MSKLSRAPGSRTPFLVVLSCSAIMSSACSSESVALYERIRDESNDKTVASGCTLYSVDSGASSSGSGAGAVDGSFRVSSESHEGGVLVEMFLDGISSSRKFYTFKELRLGKRDDFSLTAPSGRIYSASYWGALDCETPPEL